MTPQRDKSVRDEMDEIQASEVLSDVLKENKVHLGGSSMGKGLNYAARYYLRQKLSEEAQEDPFYVIDIGVVVSQVYQWRKYFERVELFYAVKCNPDPVLLKTLAILGAHFDCASKNEIMLVQKVCSSLSRKPEIVYANPCKGPFHIQQALQQGVTLMTFDNVPEVAKCAAISKDIQLILRIVTDDRGSQCRLSSKYGAPRHQWRLLLKTAQEHGLEVIGVSFHVGSGCRDATRYQEALKDARELFDIAEQEFGITMTLLDIGGGFPGETHSMWNPAEYIGDYPTSNNGEVEEDDKESKEGLDKSHESSENDGQFLFFTEIAKVVAPMIDRLFPKHVRVIGEPGRYLVAAAATLIASVIGERNNAVDASFCPAPVSDKEAATYLDRMTRQDEKTIVRKRGMSIGSESHVVNNIVEELADYSRLYARQNLTQQEADVYNDGLDLYKEGFETAADLLGPPDEDQMQKTKHSAEGMNKPLATNDENGGDGILSLAAAGEAAVSGMVLQAVADSSHVQDDYAYYINDGVYGGFNNLIYDHASVRPRRLNNHVVKNNSSDIVETCSEGFLRLNSDELNQLNGDGKGKELFASTVFGPTCDSIDVIARSVLLPKLQIGDWMYFQNMGAYTMAAASSFNGFSPTEKFYVCSIDPEHFEKLIMGPSAT